MTAPIAYASNVPFSLPADDPILVFGLAMLVFLTAPLLFQRYRIPGIVGIILVGAAIGENGLGVLERDETIVLLGEVGLVYLMFLAGLEINLDRFVESRDRSVVFGVASFVIPQAVGTVVGYAFLGLSIPGAALFAAVFASHTLLAYPIVHELGLADRESVTVTIGGTIVTDTLALLVLAVVVASTAGRLGVAFWIELGLGLTAFFVGVWLLVPRLGRWFFRTVDQESYFEYLFVMVVLFGSAYLAEVAGVEPIIGAFLAGLALNRLVPESGPLMNRIQFVGNALFVPFFLLSVGMLVDVRVLTDGLETLAVAAALLGMLLVTKYAAAWVTARTYGYTPEETMTMFGLSMGQAAAALAIVLIGTRPEVGLFDDTILNAVILLILVVSVLSPSIVDRYGRALNATEPPPTADPSSAPHRVMVPFSYASEHRDRLLDLALLVHGSKTTEPLYTLSVAREPSTESELAALEARLEETVAYGAGAEVPVERQTRVDHNVAAAIARAALENRITTLLLGWDGAPSRRQRVFGDVIDQVLTRTSQLVLVARVRQPLNTTTDVFVVLPPEIDHNEGFAATVDAIERISDEVGAPIRAIVVDDEPARFERVFERVGPDVPATFERAEGWERALDRLERGAALDRLVVAVSARRDAMGWHPALQTLPARISTATDGNFVVAYPPSGERADDRRFFRFR